MNQPEKEIKPLTQLINLTTMQQEMSVTEKLIRTLKRSINPATGRGYEYAEIGKAMGMTKEGVWYHVQKHDGDCTKCLRRLKRIKKSVQPKN